jgi:IS605 OrfB family transposase
MGQTIRTTKLLLDRGKRTRGGTNTGKQAYLEATVELLNVARAFYVAFFLAHADKLSERVSFFSEKHLEERERAISAHELLTWAEFLTVETNEHPDPLRDWNFSRAFPDFPFIYRRAVIKDAIGKVKSYLSNLSKWHHSGKKKGKPGQPGASNHPTLYEGAFSLELDALDQRESFVRLKVCTGERWTWVNYPIKYSRYFEWRRTELEWEQQSPKLVLRPKHAELHFSQVKEVKARKVSESKQDPHLVTVAVDLNVKNLAVITVRQHARIIETVFVRDHGLDQQRYRHLKRIAKKQWQSGKPVKGEHGNQQLWRHVRRMNEDAAHQVARSIANVCAEYPGCVLLFERLRTITSTGGSKSRRMNRKRANQLHGKINQFSREKAFAQGTCTVEVNPHGTSQYCSRCGAKGERFSYRGGTRIQEQWGKLFRCPVCHYEAHADFNASVNVHRSFYRQWHWQPRKKPPPKAAQCSVGGDPLSPARGRREEACGGTPR